MERQHTHEKMHDNNYKHGKNAKLRLSVKI